jgi:hypothetical protein
MNVDGLDSDYCFNANENQGIINQRSEFKSDQRQEVYEGNPPRPSESYSPENRLKIVDSYYRQSQSSSIHPSNSLHVSHLEQDESITMGSDRHAFRSLSSFSLTKEVENISCQRYLHESLRSIWYSQELQRYVCYCCAEMLTDNGFSLVGGLPEISALEEWIDFDEDEDSVLLQLNTGQEMALNLALLLCPCGIPFQQSSQSAICSMCCNATCSAACHKRLVQDQGMCIYSLNFMPTARSDVHGCRDIRWCIIERSPPGTYLSRVCGPRYLEAITGPDPNTLLIRRGYGQFGQPLSCFLEALVALPADAQRPPSAYRRNLCRCRLCERHQPHAVLHRRCRRDADPAQDDAAGLPAAHPLSDQSRAAAEASATATAVRDVSRATRRSAMTSTMAETGPDPGPGGSRAGSTVAASRQRGSVQSRASESRPSIQARTGPAAASASGGTSSWQQQSRKVRGPKLMGVPALVVLLV